MKKLLILIFSITTIFLYGFIPKKTNLQNTEKKILEIVLNNLKNKHFVSKKIDNDFSKNMFKTYLDSLDRNKIFLLKSDVEEFKKYENKLDDQINAGDLSFFYFTKDRLIMRMKESKEIYTNLLKNGVDFSTNEESLGFPGYSTNKTVSFNFAKDKTELKNRWVNFLKTAVIYSSKGSYFEKKDNYSNPDIYADYFNSINSNIQNSLESTLLNFDNMSRNFIFEYYLNSIIVQYDQHSKYFSPFTRDKYKFKESGKIEGCGITLRMANDFTEIKKLIEGGPAWKSKKFEIGDVILKVQQENEEPENVVGYTSFIIAKLLKGKTGTTVKITIKKPDGSLETIALKREIVSTNDSFIKSGIITKNNKKYAVIGFPRFYVDYDDDMVRNVADDFVKELENLKKTEVQGIVLDMRNNGGGSVEAVIKILGNFLSKKSIVQFTNKENKTSLFETENTEPKWDKSIVLLVNDRTASASEIFASAFKEYNIGVILGSQTFGKGTVQEFIDLNAFNFKKEDNEDFGMLKITTNKFYKCNGKSVQKNGIIPDVVCNVDLTLERESSLKNAIKPDQVAPIKIEPINNISFFNTIISKSQSRINENKNFNQKSESLIEKAIITKSLNFKKVTEEVKATVAKIVSETNDYNNNFEFTSTISDQKILKKKNYLDIERKKWHEKLKTDYEIEEGFNILEDMNLVKN